MTNPQPSEDTKELRQAINKIYNQATMMARLRTGSPITYVEDSIIELIAFHDRNLLAGIEEKITPILEDLVIHTANEYGGFDGFDKDADDGSRDGINEALAAIIKAATAGKEKL